MRVRIAAAVAFLMAAASGTLASADGPAAEAPQVKLGLAAAMPAVDVAQFPLGEPFPIPRPAFTPGRLRMNRLDGTKLLDVQPFDEQGEPIPEVFDEIAEAFAPRSGHTVPIDPRLIELIMTISSAFDGKPVALVSGHREPGSGTRKTSYHVRGKAADIAIVGERVHDLRDVAIELGAWGVGVYPSFVHIDARVDRPYYWVGSTYRRWRYVRSRARAMRAKARAKRRARRARMRRR